MAGTWGAVAHAAAEVQGSERLLQTYRELQTRLQNNVYKQPLVIASSEVGPQIQGEVFAVLDFPIATVAASLEQPGAWCEIMILHINTKQCVVASGDRLGVHIGKKTPEPLADTTRIDFVFRRVHKSATELQVEMDAERGPLGTSGYRIVLEAVALPQSQTFLHLTYAYRVNLAGKLALGAYLGSVGKDKVGFSTQEVGGAGATRLVGGVRGLVERNTMRYYLAIDAYLRSLALAPGVQVESRLQTWYQQSERYPRQLHEVDRGAYLEMKRAEIARQRAATE
ncbi:MAG: hypothetical protein H7Y28_09930 [Rhodoferax sp.]|nr:hypothetical protein [Rhodoferax sp.]